eukprot:30612-Pelagococcus_subviridis.AAC.15
MAASVPRPPPSSPADAVFPFPASSFTTPTAAAPDAAAARIAFAIPSSSTLGGMILNILSAFSGIP